MVIRKSRYRISFCTPTPSALAMKLAVVWRNLWKRSGPGSGFG
jgi:hypothetical protein